MKLTEAYTVFNNNLHSMDPQLAEAIDRILDDKNKQLEKLDQVELAEAKARMEIERLRGIIINAGCAMAEGENGDAYRYLYNGIGNGDYNYFERINEEEERKFSKAIWQRLSKRLAGESNV